MKGPSVLAAQLKNKWSVQREIPDDDYMKAIRWNNSKGSFVRQIVSIQDVWETRRRLENTGRKTGAAVRAV